MIQSRGLGKGLDALLSNIEDTGGVDVRLVPVDSIKPSPYQPRREYDPAKIEELAISIKEHGLLQPIILRRVDRGFEIVAGERRWRAAKMAGVVEIPAVVRDVDAKSAMAVALVENIQREDLNPVEEAAAFKRLVDEFGISQEAIGEMIGKSRSYVANILRLLKLPEKVRVLLREGKIDMGHARALLSLENPDTQISLANLVAEKRLSVREVERLVKLRTSESGTSDRHRLKRVRLTDIENSLERVLGLSVKVYVQDKHRLEIKFKSDNERADFIKLLKEKLAPERR
ncbi:MAG: ParB/RepB/Spo0J family partition protein [Synergistetes bacterium]|nr:ParB/RepB/Spo0J family partition protein [Synergistota bacterium]